MKRKNIAYQCALLALTILVFAGYLVFRQVRADHTGPEISVSGGIPEVSVRDPQDTYLQGVTAKDDRDGDVTDRMLVESVYGITEDHQATVTYAAFDRAGNVTKAQRQIRFTDYHSPRFTLEQALVFPSTSGLDVMDYIGARDVIDGDMIHRVRATLISNSGTLSDVGVHDVKLQVTNSLGDTAQLVLPVEVYEPEKYNASLELETYLVYLPAGASFDAESYLVSVTFGGITRSLETIPEDVSVSVAHSVRMQEPGVYPVSYTVRCTRNGSAYTAYSRLFVVVEE